MIDKQVQTTQASFTSSAYQSFTHNKTLALSLYQSEEQFPIDLDDAWQWLKYANKENCLNVIKNNFEEGMDFSWSSRKSPNGGRPKNCIMLSVECFKCLAMMAGTEQGKVIRGYFLECERRIRVLYAPLVIINVFRYRYTC